MPKNKPLTLSEVKQLQIEMLIEFDKFCRANDITYFLSYGTLLGAIRHKGYIPWDDDVDVMVPRPEIEKLKQLFNAKGLPEYKICDSDNEPGYDMPYPRMIAKNTYSKTGLISTSYGVNIDIYPIDAFPDSKKSLASYRNDIKKIRDKRLFLIRIGNRLLRIFPIKRIPLIRYYSQLHAKALNKYDYDSAKYVHVFYPVQTPFDKRYLTDKVEVYFEGHKFYAPSGWHEFLTMSYGDYMELPPEEKRHPYHGTQNIYWR